MKILNTIIPYLSFFLIILLEYVHAVKFAIEMLLPVVCQKGPTGLLFYVEQYAAHKNLCLCLSQNVSKFLSLTIFKMDFCRCKSYRVKLISLSHVFR